MITTVERHFAKAILQGWLDSILFFTEEEFIKITGRASHILPAGSYILLRLNREGTKPIESEVDVRLHRAIHLIIDNCPDFPSRKESGVLSPSLYKNAMATMSAASICEAPQRGTRGKWLVDLPKRLAYKEHF